MTDVHTLESLPTGRRTGPRLARLRAHAHALPDFILPGVQKGGTTSLYRDLAKHPNVLGVRAKEIFYFDQNHDAGDAWYRCWFPTRRAVEKRKREIGGVALTGEATASYLDHPRVPGAAAALVPEAKIVMVLRDPAERAISHYFHNRRKKREPLDLLDALRAESERLDGEPSRVLDDPGAPSIPLLHYSYLRRGRYAEHLARWRDHFPDDHILVLRSEDYFADPASVFQETTRFLGLPDWDAGQYPAENPGHNRREIDPEARAFLADYFRPHNAELERMTGRDFGWGA